MARFLPKVYLDYISFWAGIIIAIILIILFFRFRSRLFAFVKTTYAQLHALQGKITVSSGSNYLRILHLFVQTKHITSSLFPLEKVVIPPKCIASPPAITPGEVTYDPSLLQQTLGYDPALPELAIEYNAPTLTLLEALTKGANLALLGYPGMGKTVAFAETISELLKGNHIYPELQGKIPFLVEAQQIINQFPGSDVLEILITAIEIDPAFSSIPKFPDYITSNINSNNAILFIDGLDTLNSENTDRLANFLIALCKIMPGLQVIIAVSPAYIGNLIKAPFEFISVAPWGKKEKLHFLEKWSLAWNEHSSSGEASVYDKNQIINNMLTIGSKNLTPLEFTLNSWAAYAGDISGPHATNAYQSFLNRITASTTDKNFKTLERIAVFLLGQKMDSFSKQDIISLTSKIPNNHPADPSPEKTSPANREIQIALNHKIIQRAGTNRLYFSCPSVAGYFAARGLASTNESTTKQIISKPEWSLLHETMRFFSAFNNIGSYLDDFLADQSLFKEKLISICHWLAHANLPNDDLVPVLKTITAEIQNNTIYLVQLRLIIALAKSGNPNINNIIRYLLKSQKSNTKRAAAVCAGFIQDQGSIPQLINQLNDPFPCSTAACYALGMLGSTSALEAVAESLLRGDELLRRSAAESLSNNRSEGHPSLREGATMDDLLVRYAVVHGLGLINEDWSNEILDRMRIDEDEWIVRDLAQHVYQINQTSSPFIPQPQVPLHQAAWLRSFSEQHNLAMLSVETALELLLKALEIGSEEQKQASLPYLMDIGGEEVYQPMLRALDDPNHNVQQQASLALWFSTPSGYQAPGH